MEGLYLPTVPPSAYPQAHEHDFWSKQLRELQVWDPAV